MKTIPKQTGRTDLTDIALGDVLPFIDWSGFFLAWRLTGGYKGIGEALHCPACREGWLRSFGEAQREKASEALKLYADAQEALRNFREEKNIRIQASLLLLPARSEGDNIVVQYETEEYCLPMLRQQTPSSDGYCYCLADFVDTQDDYVGFFACSVQGAEQMAAEAEADDNSYRAILIKTLADRLAEASAEYLHYHVRKHYWGYAPKEEVDIDAIHKAKYQGIRPAVGYPSLPDQSLIFELDKFIDYKRTGIRLTENGAMYPNASVSGMYFAHPQARYFAVGRIDAQQLDDYARRRGRTSDEMRKWLAPNID